MRLGHRNPFCPLSLCSLLLPAWLTLLVPVVWCPLQFDSRACCSIFTTRVLTQIG